MKSYALKTEVRMKIFSRLRSVVPFEKIKNTQLILIVVFLCTIQCSQSKEALLSETLLNPVPQPSSSLP
jgi:hypothetical protein